MRLQDIFESRNGLLLYLKSKFPTWPEYVIRDFLYRIVKDDTSQYAINDVLDSVREQCGRGIWKLEKLEITFDIFDKDTSDWMKERIARYAPNNLPPNDAQRHVQQAELLNQRGISKEPIIVIKINDGYDLIEGWHRTIQSLKMFPEGYIGPAWVCYP